LRVAAAGAHFYFSNSFLRFSNDHMDGESLLLLWALSGSGDISGAASFVSSAPGSSFVGVSVRRRL